MTSAPEVILWGASGHARVLREALGPSVRIVAVFDNDPDAPSPFPDVPLFHGERGFTAWLAARKPDALRAGFLVAIGGECGKDRLAIHARLEGAGLRPMTAVHRTAFVADGVPIGDGSQILVGTVVGTGSIVGRQCIVNTSASVDHECVLKDGVHIAPGAHLAGCVVVERCATVYTGASVLPRVRIGRHAVIGAGSVVLRDVPPGAVVVGNPGRIVGTRPID